MLRSFAELPRRDVEQMRAKVDDKVLMLSVELLMRHPKVQKVSLGTSHLSRVSSRPAGTIEPWMDLDRGIGFKAKGYSTMSVQTLFVYCAPADRAEIEAFLKALPAAPRASAIV